MLHAAPVALIALYGAGWIALHAGGGRGSTHTLWQSLALTETVLALLLRARKPVGALAGILAAYLLFNLDPLLLPAVLLALLTVAAIRDHRTVAAATTATAAVLAATPYIRGDEVSLAGYSLPRLAAAGAVVAAGIYLRTRRNRRAVNPAGQVAGKRGGGEPDGHPWTAPPSRTSHAMNDPARRMSSSTVPATGANANGSKRGDHK